MAEDSTQKQGKNRPRLDHDVSHLAQDDTENETDGIIDEDGSSAPSKTVPRKKMRKMRRRALAAQSELNALREEMAQMPAYPVARVAHMRKRHWGVVASFVMLVVVPAVLLVFYMFAVAEDQYASVTGFTVRSQESSSATDLLGGLASFAGNSTASDSDILYEFIRSKEIVAAVDARVDLVTHYSQHWPKDPLFALWPTASLEDLEWFWNRIVDISYSSNTGLIDVQVLAYEPKFATAIAQAIVDESQIRINALNEQAREDAMGYAENDLQIAVADLKRAREAITEFRTRTRIVDPQADIQSRMGVMSSLQQKLAEALIELDLLKSTTIDSDPRLAKSERTIEVIRERIESERAAFTSDTTETGAVGQDYPSLFAEYERLTVDLEFAQQRYSAALAAMEAARDTLSRQSRYLATYINPTIAETSHYPRRYVISALGILFLVLTWSIGILLYYSVQDRR
ncbi:sugar transporter [Celeribacter sp.]|uniref:sugar transporter n=1 Tax=Celeribacter sp. TaxID=1890673 RepID=UPI003A953536